MTRPALRWMVAGLVIGATACSGSTRLDDAVQPQPVEPPEATNLALPDCPDTAGADPTRTYAPDPAAPTPSVDAIRARGRLIVGVSADTLLFGSANSLKEGTPIEGFDIDIVAQVAAAIFEVDPDQVDARQLIEYRVITYAQRIPKLLDGPDNGGVDIVAHTMTINCRRWQLIAFSSTYYLAGQKVLVSKESGVTGLDDLVAAGATVCAPAGSTNEEYILGFTDDGLQVASEADLTDCLVGMQQGRYDAATGDDTVLAGFAAQDPNTVVVGERLTDEPYGMGIAADRTDLVQFVNSVLEEVRSDGRWADIYDRWLVQTGALAGDIPEPPAAVYGRELP